MSPEELAAIQAEWALRADAQRRNTSRGLPFETHEERMARYRRDQQLQDSAQMRAYWAREELEHQKRYEEEHRHWLEQQLIEQKKEQERQRHLTKKAAFDRWQSQNESGGRDANTEWRASERQREDDKLYRQIIDRYEDEKYSWVYWNPGMTNAMLSCLGDHDYIEWMFECHGRGLIV